MENDQLKSFLVKLKFKKNLLLSLVSLGFLLLLYILFVQEFPFKVNRSWVIVPTLLFSVLGALGVLKVKKNIKYYTSVVKKNTMKNGLFKVTKEREWKQGVDFFAEVEVEQKHWEIHLFPPMFTDAQLLDAPQSVEVYFDTLERPAILTTNSGWLFINSARARR